MFLHARGVRFESVTLRGKEVAEPRCEINRAQQWRKIVSRAIEAIEAEMNFETRILKLNVPQETALESVGLELRIGRCSAKSRDKAIDVTDRTDRYAFSVDAIVDATRLRARARARKDLKRIARFLRGVTSPAASDFPVTFTDTRKKNAKKRRRRSGRCRRASVRLRIYSARYNQKRERERERGDSIPRIHDESARG